MADADAYRVTGDVELKLWSGDRYDPGEEVPADALEDDERESLVRTGYLEPAGDGSEEVSVEHDVPPEDDEGGDAVDSSEWEDDYRAAQQKAGELDVSAQGTHEELKQRIQDALEED